MATYEVKDTSGEVHTVTASSVEVIGNHQLKLYSTSFAGTDMLVAAFSGFQYFKQIVPYEAG